jgi:hypothetical protein
MNKIKTQLKSLKAEKVFLEKKIKDAVSDLDFVNYFNFINEQKRIMDYLNISWLQYDELITKIKELKRDLKGSK